jgi:hypothetical protein
VILGLAVASWLRAPAPIVAQGRPEVREGPVWTLEGLRTGQCVRFLLDPTKAPRELLDGARLVAASQDQSLHPALRTVIDGQPEFAGWTSSSLCLFYVEALTVGARRIAAKDPRKRQMIGLWTVAASEQGGRARRDVVLSFFGVGRGLIQTAGFTKVKLREAESSVSKAPDTDNDLFTVKIGKTRLVWNGRAVGDSTRVEQPIQESWLAKGTFETVWRVHATLRPEWSRPLAGVLRVEGKDDLAKALKASPIRFVGPLYEGGGGELRFSR